MNAIVDDIAKGLKILYLERIQNLKNVRILIKLISRVEQRIQLLEYFKRWVVFECGKIQDLKQQNSIYKHMVEMQMQSHN